MLCLQALLKFQQPAPLTQSAKEVQKKVEDADKDIAKVRGLVVVTNICMPRCNSMSRLYLHCIRCRIGDLPPLVVGVVLCVSFVVT
jgi:hypothetical protein